MALRFGLLVVAMVNVGAPIPMAAASRNMMPTRDGKGFALACSGVNDVALVTIN